MTVKKKRPWLFLLAALLSAGVSIIVFLKVVLANDTTGRLIFGIVWALIAVIWFGQYLSLKNKGSHHDEQP